MLRVVMRKLSFLFSSIAVLGIACSSGDKSGGDTLTTDSGGLHPDGGGDSNNTFDTGTNTDGLLGDVTPNDSGPPGGTPIVYANTDVDLWSLDPTTKAVTKIGDFAGTTDPITDVAVNGDNAVFVNSETTLYTATLPSGGSGPVNLAVKATLPSTAKFYALGFVPKGVLTADEALIAGDGAGNLYYLDVSSSTATAQNLGSFGVFATGDPDPGGKAKPGDLWTLSGDVVFYLDPSGAPQGLATVRTCYTTSSSTKCNADNDSLVAVDMNALKNNFTTKSSTASLKKAFISGASGTGTGRLFGLGAWDDKVYAFSRNYNGSTSSPAVPPELVSIDASGTATVLQKFESAGTPQFTNGWSGAGVTTKAKISVIK